MNRLITRLCAPILLGCALLLAACGGAPTLTQQTSSYIIKLSLDALKVGDRTATLTITDAAGQPVVADAVTLAPTMLSMGMASPKGTAQASGSGQYTSQPLLFSMTGEWELDVIVQKGGQQEVARFLLTIPTE